MRLIGGDDTPSLDLVTSEIGAENLRLVGDLYLDRRFNDCDPTIKIVGLVRQWCHQSGHLLADIPDEETQVQGTIFPTDYPDKRIDVMTLQTDDRNYETTFVLTSVVSPPTDWFRTHANSNPDFVLIGNPF